MLNTTLHTSFKLNGLQFSSIKELLLYIKGVSEDSYQFLLTWFDERDYVEVQTSGSTGKPKLIRLKKGYMKNSAVATGTFFNLQENTTALVCLSANYIAGKMMLVRALTLGWHIDIIASTSTPLLQTDLIYDFSAMVPMQLQNSLSEIHRVKKLIVGGGVVSDTLINEIQNISTQIYATYGMTETITHIAVKPLNCFSKENTISFYKVLPSVNIYIDQRSCLVIEAPNVSDELVVTNDVVQLISDNTFEWIGRFDNVINSGGVKLHPEQIEEKLSKVIKNRFFVSAVSDEVLGQKLILIVESPAYDLGDLTIYLSKYEIPKSIYFLDVFVETSTNKIQRNKTLSLL